MMATGRVKSRVPAACARIASVSRRSASRYAVTPSGLLVSSPEGVREHQRVVVDVDDAALRHDGLGHLVGVVSRGQAGADVEELAYARLGGQVAHAAGQEGP